MNRFVLKVYSIIILLFICGIFTEISSAKSKESFTNLSIEKEDRILILAPHPDDEVIGCGGVIQEAVKLGAKLKILYLTEGEHNPISLISYEKKIFFKNRQQAFIKLGKIRKQESIAAVNTLGINKSKLTFLDYPDSGIRAIFTEYWGKNNKYKDSLTGLYQAEPGEGIEPNAPYIGDTILSEIENVIEKFKPTKIFCSHPLDHHGDHIGFYLFLKVALWELQDKIPEPEIYLYVVHYRNWPRPYGLYPDKILSPPQKLSNLSLKWFIFKLTQDEIERKREALMKFKSQIKYSRKYLLSFIRSNEIFSKELGDINLVNNLNYILKGEGEIKNISLHYEGNKLAIYINFLKRILNRNNINGTLFLFGYKNKKPFKDMPKIKIGFRSSRWCVYNLEHKIKAQEVSFKFKPNGMYFEIPLSILGNPNFILYSLKSDLIGIKTDRWSCWRTITLK